MNDEYGRDSLTELIALLTLPSQQDNDYVMGRHSDGPQHMESRIPLSVLADDDFTPTIGEPRGRWSSLEPKRGLWTTTQGKLTLEQLNAAAKGAKLPAEDPRLRYLDDVWIKWHADDPRAAELYEVTQRGSSLAGSGSELRQADLAAAARAG